MAIQAKQNGAGSPPSVRSTDDLRISETRYRRLFESARDGILILDPETRKITDANPFMTELLGYANDAFTSITGYESEDIIGQSCAILQGPDTDPDTILQMRCALRAGQPFDREILNYRKDGTPFWNDLSISPIRGKQGEPIRFIGILRDITVRKQAQEALQASEKDLTRKRRLYFDGPANAPEGRIRGHFGNP